MGWNGTLVPFFWVLLLIFAIQAIGNKLPRLRIPTIILYILLGIFIGNGGLPFIHMKDLQWLNGISQFGLFFLMFLSGLEIDIDQIKGSPRVHKNLNRSLMKGPVFLSLAILVTTLLLSYGLSVVMELLDHRIQAWMMMLILSTTSLGIVLPVLKERGLQKGVYGQTLLTAALLADFITMLAISIAADTYHSHFSWDQLLVGLFLPLFVLIYQFIYRLLKSETLSKWFGSNLVFKSQAVLALLGLFGVIADITGTEPILGSFLAGFLLSCFRLNERSTLRGSLETMGYSFIIPIFFVMVGAHFSLSSFLATQGIGRWVFLLLACSYAVKVLPMLWFGNRFGPKASLAGGILLSSRMTLVLVASSIAIQLGIIPPYINEALLVVAVVTCILSPILFSVIQRGEQWT